MINKQYTIFCDGAMRTPILDHYTHEVIAAAGDPCTSWAYVEGETTAQAWASARRMGWQKLPDGTHRCPSHREKE